jgi:pilus assembly protein CpaC
MSSRKIVNGARRGGLVLLALVALASEPFAAERERLRVAVGRAVVVESSEDVRTVAIAEPKIADAAVGSARTVVVNAKSAGVTSLVVYTEGGRYRIYDVESYVPNADRQVALHVRVAEVNETAKKEIGFDWFGEGNVLGSLDGFLQGGVYPTKVSDPTAPLVLPPPLGPNTDGFVHFEHASGDWSLETKWKALEETGDLRTLANPTLVARSGEKSSFLVGGEIAVPIASGSSAGGTTVTIEWKEFGVRLGFTPDVEEDGSITLHVAPEVSQLDFTNPLTLSGFTVPTLITRKTATTVTMKSGEHLVIGGLKHSDRNKVVRKVPLLGSIPLLGFFFTNTRTETVEREMLVVVSPEVLAGASTTLPALPTDRHLETPKTR